MPAISKDVKDRIGVVTGIAGTIFHYGYIPLVLYLGYKRGADPGMPALTLVSLLGIPG